MNVIPAPPGIWAVYTPGDTPPDSCDGARSFPVVAFRTDTVATDLTEAECSALVCGHHGELIPADAYEVGGYLLQTVEWRAP